MLTTSQCYPLLVLVLWQREALMDLVTDQHFACPWDSAHLELELLCSTPKNFVRYLCSVLPVIACCLTWMD